VASARVRKRGKRRQSACKVPLRQRLQLNGVEPLAWLTDVLERMVSGRTKATELDRLLPWNWKAEQLAAAVNG
jgi:transposase